MLLSRAEVMFLMLFPLFSLSSQEPNYSALSSEHASYDGNCLILKGEVHLDHHFGKMNANEAVLKKQSVGKDFPFSQIHLEKQVVLQLKNNAELRCDLADLDFGTLKGVLTSSDGKVIYNDIIQNRDNHPSPFQLSSSRLELDIIDSSSSEKPAYEIDTIRALDDVRIEYEKEFVLLADHALFKSGKDSKKTATAYPKNPDSRCHLIHEEDRIDCDRVEFSFADAKMILHQPEGHLVSSLVPNIPKGDLFFHARLLTWDAQNSTLTLKGNVQLDESSFGRLETDEEISLIQKQENGKRIVSSARTTGKTILEYKTAKGISPQRLTSFGSILIDREKHHAYAESPVSKGKVEESKQLIFENEDSVIYADKSFLEYVLTEDSLEPASLDLKGNVRLITRHLNKTVRCAIADRINYSPNTQTLILSANRGKRVLFWSEEQTLRVSAHEVHISRDPLTKKDSVKGVGNVRFAFTLEEHDTLNRLFPNYISLPKDLK